jgi:hypothetical protein
VPLPGSGAFGGDFLETPIEINLAVLAQHHSIDASTPGSITLLIHLRSDGCAGGYLQNPDALFLLATIELRYAPALTVTALCDVRVIAYAGAIDGALISDIPDMSNGVTNVPCGDLNTSLEKAAAAGSASATFSASAATTYQVTGSSIIATGQATTMGHAASPSAEHARGAVGRGQGEINHRLSFTASTPMTLEISFTFSFGPCDPYPHVEVRINFLTRSDRTGIKSTLVRCGAPGGSVTETRELQSGEILNLDIASLYKVLVKTGAGSEQPLDWTFSGGLMWTYTVRMRPTN